MCFRCLCSSYHFFSTDPAPPEISTLSLHDALPISTWRQFSVTAHAGSHRSLSTCCCRVVARCAWLSSAYARGRVIAFRRRADWYLRYVAWSARNISCVSNYHRYWGCLFIHRVAQHRNYPVGSSHQTTSGPVTLAAYCCCRSTVGCGTTFCQYLWCWRYHVGGSHGTRRFCCPHACPTFYRAMVNCRSYPLAATAC